MVICLFKVVWETAFELVPQSILGGFGERISKMPFIVITTNQDLKDVTLEANDIPGAELSKPPELCTVAMLKRWLSCRGAKVSGKCHELIKRFVAVSTIKHATSVIFI